MDFTVFPRIESFDSWCGYFVSSGEFDRLIYGYSSKIIGYIGDDLFWNKPYLERIFLLGLRCSVFRRGLVDNLVKEALDYPVLQSELVKSRPEAY